MQARQYLWKEMDSRLFGLGPSFRLQVGWLGSFQTAQQMIDLWTVKKAVKAYSTIQIIYGYGHKNDRWSLIWESVMLCSLGDQM